MIDTQLNKKGAVTFVTRTLIAAAVVAAKESESSHCALTMALPAFSYQSVGFVVRLYDNVFTAKYELEWAHLESNQGPTGYEPVALPAELWALTALI